jgi:signal transduction histidine kinase
VTVPRADDEIGRLGRTLNEMLDRVEASVERERRFVADASHELRTPRAALTTELELALRRPRSAAELGGALRSAAEESGRLAEDLLLLARADDGALASAPANVAVAPLLERVARRFRGRAERAGRAVLVAAREGDMIAGDAAALEQALGNLVDNALRHGEGEVTLASRTAGGAVELHVRDEGPGFPTAFHPHAFDRFSRADDARARGGTGLGLAIVLAVAGAHGGTAHAENRDGGADMWMALPRRD